MKLIAVCAGQVAPMMYRTASGDLKTVASGIKKTPISSMDNPESIKVNRLGLQGDEQSDLSVHGGLDKAVYMMPAQHYAFWAERRKEKSLDPELPFGFLGENLVVEGVDETQVCIGDEFKFNDVVLRVTDPREPCYKFAIKMGYGTAPKQMLQAGNCGWYLKVIKAGNIRAGETFEIIRTDKHATVLERFNKLTKKGQMDLL